jgi:hypothetical protein
MANFKDRILKIETAFLKTWEYLCNINNHEEYQENNNLAKQKQYKLMRFQNRSE